jgi:hypothetical protein
MDALNTTTMTDYVGMWRESVVSGIFPHVPNTPTGGTLLNAGFGGTGNSGIDSAVLSGYTSWQVTREIWLGLAWITPFASRSILPILSPAAFMRATPA